jgi:hypothetical protein
MFDRPSYNHIQDSTGSNGALPDAEYDINCPALGMPDFKLNYLAESCAIRLASKVKRSACSFGDGCPRFRPTVATVKPPPRKRMVRTSNKDHTCVCCGKKGEHHCRGLINACYKRHRKKGNIEMFPIIYSPYVFTEEAK